MRYLIIGLGIYGSNLARDLTDMGHEVIGADSAKSNVDAIKDYISTVYLIDATDEASLELLPINNVDLAIVAIGENFGASIKVVALLKKMKVKHIYARAIDRLHESILEGFEIDRIITPEQRAARDLTFEMGLGSAVQTLKIDEDTYIIRFKAPSILVGLKYSDIDLERTYRLRLVAVTREKESVNLLGIRGHAPALFDFENADATVSADDILTCCGPRQGFAMLSRQTQD